MSFGKMNALIYVSSKNYSMNGEGFPLQVYFGGRQFHAYAEPKNSTEKWVNLSRFSEADMLFRFRKQPGMVVTTKQFIIYKSKRYNILSVEDVRGRGMYLEVLAKVVEPSG